MSMMGELNYFRGLQIKQKKDGISISQTKYLNDLLKKFGMDYGVSSLKVLMIVNDCKQSIKFALSCWKIDRESKPRGLSRNL